MDRRKTYWRLIIVAIIGMVLTLVYLLPLELDLIAPVILLNKLIFILAVYYSMLLCEEKQTKVLHYGYLGILGLLFLKDLAIYGCSLFEIEMPLDISTSALFYVTYGVTIVLLALLLIKGSKGGRLHWMFLGALLYQIQDLTKILLMRYNSSFGMWTITHLETVNYITVAFELLWIIGAIIMGVRGLAKPEEKAVKWEEEEIV